jgi:hypothetical protein
MTKTENLNLPQWESTDAFQRADFNNAFAALDTGYAAVMTVAERAESMASAALDGTAAEEANFDRLCRAAYNHWHLLETTGGSAWQLGRFSQGFAEEDNDHTFSGTVLQRDDLVWIGNNGGLLTLDSMRSTLSQSYKLNNSNNNYYINFTPPYSGRVTKLTLSGSYSGNTDGNTGACTVTLVNRTTGETEATTASTFGLSGGNSGSGQFSLDFDFLVHAAQDYRIYVVLDTMNFSPGFSADLTGSCLTVQGYQLPSASITHSWQEPGTSSGGVVLVQYGAWGNGASLRLQWDDEVLEPVLVRPISDGAGGTRQEAEFRRSDTVPADSTLTLHLACDEGSEVWAYRWGAMLL